MKKKVVILQPYIAPYRVNLFNEINNFDDIDLYLLYFNKTEERRKWNNTPICKFKQVQLHPVIFHFNYEKNITIPNIAELVRFLIKIKPDMIICSPNIEGMVLCYLKNIFKYRIASWMESTNITEKNISLIKKYLRYNFFKNINHFIIPGKKTEEYLNSNKYIKNREKLYFAPNTIDQEKYLLTENEVKNKFENIKHLRFLFSGSLIERKGFHLLQKAFQDLSGYSFPYTYELNVAGSGNLPEYQIQHVNYKGFLQGDEYRELFKSSHVFVLPSLRDCNPLTVVEAINAGNILLLSDAVGNYPEFVKGNGFVFKSNSKNAIKDSLFKLMNLNNEVFKEIALKSISIANNINHKNSALSFYQAMMSK
ncbi:MAG: hypothetical protein DKM50_01925 [Candidatus Margulisiibacteriota bacterium]|nr:MAG: hypothetical protein A2X43_13220 [Candidatus Margulisbacteria bacterium GWD2_39_127]OGI04782.1 MAG: hypothetical protein A2X42_10775 [Candidatus Margulisbacteria bacterium GWF2_38_17]OGI05727.1 MAG: hypothetical protein A2X41_03360 [Candidatus Margulisbacteria bacterium GWE2_39_32]PZM83662.1 MAG: hypothetical protein DKM50_01925 [Candidatus Margulisiibacteriota bacterium]HAR62080.1 hypothetical protein [Candidatus Margulisiibacteriota bacterium]